MSTLSVLNTEHFDCWSTKIWEEEEVVGLSGVWWGEFSLQPRGWCLGQFFPTLIRTGIDMGTHELSWSEFYKRMIWQNYI